jgi:hypothetical protein
MWTGKNLNCLLLTRKKTIIMSKIHLVISLKNYWGKLFCNQKNLTPNKKNRKIKPRAMEASPVIRGKDAVRFWKQLEENKTKKVDKALLESILEAGRVMESIRVKRDI